METPHEQHGKYRPIAELGQGGTANVYLAVARGPNDFNKLVVLKVLKSELAGEEDFRRMFMSEARLSARLNHTNVVQTNEVFETDGRPVIVMEYLEGQPLSRIVARARSDEAWQKKLTLALHLSILIEALSGLHHSHELADYDGTPLGVVHRDMTPQNVFVSYDGRVCVLDFGIAKLKNVHETQTGVVKGKLRYMPPEQLLGDAIDRRADIFAIGVMLWEAATGAKLWEGMADPTVVHRVLSGQIPAPRETKPDVPEELERIVMKALSHDREQRHATAADLQAELEEFAKKQKLPSQREVGALVNEMFVEQRRKMRSLIEGQIASLAAKKSSEDTDSGLRMPTGSFLPTAYTNTLSEPPPRPAAPTAPPPASTTRKLWPLGLSVVALAVLLFAWRREHEAAATEVGRSTATGEMSDRARPGGAVQSERAANAPVEAEPATKNAPAEPIAEEPRDDALGDEPAAEPAAVEHRDAKRRRASDARKARARSDAQQAVEPSAQVVSDAPTEPESAAKPSREGECDVPYFVDASGIRRIKRECLNKAE